MVINFISFHKSTFFRFCSIFFIYSWDKCNVLLCAVGITFNNIEIFNSDLNFLFCFCSANSVDTVFFCLYRVKLKHFKKFEDTTDALAGMKSLFPFYLYCCPLQC